MTESCANLTIRLRELSPADLPALNRWRNDEAVMSFLGNNFLYIAEPVDEAWYQSYLNHRHQQVRLAIEVVETGDYIGNVNLTGIHRVNGSAEFSIVIGEKLYWGKGLGAQATRKMLDHAFGDLNLNRVELSVLTENTRALRLYQGLGFVEEGCLRQAVFKQGEYKDLLLMAMLRQDDRLKSS